MYIYLYVQLQKKHAQIRNANETNGQNIKKYLPTHHIPQYISFHFVHFREEK